MSEESLAQTGRLQKQNLHLLRGVKKKRRKKHKVILWDCRTKPSGWLAGFMIFITLKGLISDVGLSSTNQISNHNNDNQACQGSANNDWNQKAAVVQWALMGCRQREIMHKNVIKNKLIKAHSFLCFDFRNAKNRRVKTNQIFTTPFFSKSDSYTEDIRHGFQDNLSLVQIERVCLTVHCNSKVQLFS